MTAVEKGHIGPSFDDVLEEEGIREGVQRYSLGSLSGR